MDIKQTIEESLDKLKGLASHRDDIESQMGRLHLAIRGLCNLVDDAAEREGYKAVLERFKVRIGLTDLVLLALAFDKPLTVKEIREFIRNFGSDAGTQPNLLQSIYTVISRLVDSGKVIEVITEDGEKAYRRKGIAEIILDTARGVNQGDANRIGKRIEKRFPPGMTKLAEMMNPDFKVMLEKKIEAREKKK